MPYEIKRQEDKFCVFKKGTDKVIDCHDSEIQAKEQIFALEMAENSQKQVNLTFNEIDGIIDGEIEISGYLYRFSTDNQLDKDLTNEHWEKSTHINKETFPIVGAPVMFGHSEEDEFTKVGIGIVNYASEDDIGMFIKAQLHKREKWRKIVEEVNQRRKLGYSMKQVNELADRAYENMKRVVKSIPLQWSMGSYPPLYSTDRKTKKIETVGIVEATLTPVPAEPKGTEALVSFKSVLNTLNLKEQDAKEDQSDEQIFLNENIRNLNNYKSNSEVYKQMDEKEKSPVIEKEVEYSVQEDVQKAMNEFMQKSMKEIRSRMEKAFGAPMEEKEEEEMKAMVEKEAKKSLSSDMLYKKSVGSDNLKEIVEEILRDKQPEISAKAVENFLNSEKELAQNTQKSIDDILRRYAPDEEKTQGGFMVDKNSRKSFGRVEFTEKKFTLADELRNQYYMKNAPLSVDEDWFRHKNYQKAQNPYIGTLGGDLLGQQMATTILDPLRPEVVTFQAGVTQTNVSGIGVYIRNRMTTVPSAYRPGINQPITGSDSKYEPIQAFLRPLACEVIIPRQMLLQTQTNMEEQIKRQAMDSLRLQIDKEILEGVGTVTGSNTGAEIKGIKRVLADSDYSATNLKTLATNGRKPKYDDLINAETQINNENVPLDGNSSAWIMHPRDWGTFRKMTDSTGQPLQYPNYAENSRQDLIGYNVFKTTQIDNAQTVGTSSDCSDIYFGNWKFVEYVLGNDIEVIYDDISLASNLQVKYVFYLYSDVIVHYPQAFYVMQGVRNA